MNNLFYNLPVELKIKIWEYDSTYKTKYDTCIKELKTVKDLHKIYKKRNYKLIKKHEIYDFSKYYINQYNNKHYSKTLFRYYYGNIFNSYVE